MRQTAVFVMLLATGLVTELRAQAPTPDSLARLVVHRFATATPQAFDSVDPDPLGRAVVETAVDRHFVRAPGLARVLVAGPDRAVLLLTAIVREPGTASGLEAGGDQTNRVRRFSGLYEAVRTGGTWALARQIPFDSTNEIRAQTIHVALTPGGLSRIRDTL
ncbi:MAG TPA: hypothetical protein VNW46_00925, partial [Gemmatimonadaceae bacterium]|nr:hypothetical protein [Gemmatimonadaceae bacterium]